MHASSTARKRGTSSERVLWFGLPNDWMDLVDGLEPWFGTWENHGKTMGTPWEHHAEMVIYIVIMSGWWFGTMEFYDFPIQLGMSSSQLTSSIIFQRGRAQPPTRDGGYQESKNVGDTKAARTYCRQKTDFWVNRLIWSVGRLLPQMEEYGLLSR